MNSDVYLLPDLAYDPAALEPHISGRIMELHHDKHHAAYVKGANAALARLQDTREQGEFATISMLEKNLAFNVSGHVLHSVFWTNLSPNGGGEPSGELGELIEETFGGFPAFRQQIMEAASTIQGSGWALASWEPMAGRLVVQQVYDHQGNHGQGRFRCSRSTHGSTPSTCSTKTERATSSTLSGTSSTGAMWLTACGALGSQRPNPSSVTVRMLSRYSEAQLG
jgi:Fe-Mn family superoxide dismutase